MLYTTVDINSMRNDFFLDNYYNKYINNILGFFMLESTRRRDIVAAMRKAHLLYRDEEKTPLASHYILEGVDDKHRDKALLNEKYAEWEKLPFSQDTKSFWKWLDTKYPELSKAQGVKYLSKEVRDDYKLSIDSEGFVRLGKSENPYDTTSFSGKSPGMAAYVMDRDGNIYVGEHKTGELHHSSFLAGEAVISAGMVKIEKGKITYIDHRSGHYTPTKENLVNCLKKVDSKSFSSDAKIGLSGEIESQTKQKIAEFFISIRENQYLNWLPVKWLSSLVQFGRHLELNNQKSSIIKATDYYQNVNSNAQGTQQGDIKNRIEAMRKSTPPQAPTVVESGGHFNNFQPPNVFKAAHCHQNPDPKSQITEEGMTPSPEKSPIISK